MSDRFEGHSEAACSVSSDKHHAGLISIDDTRNLFCNELHHRNNSGAALEHVGVLPQAGIDLLGNISFHLEHLFSGRRHHPKDSSNSSATKSDTNESKAHGRDAKHPHSSDAKHPHFGSDAKHPYPGSNAKHLHPDSDAKHLHPGFDTHSHAATDSKAITSNGAPKGEGKHNSTDRPAPGRKQHLVPDNRATATPDTANIERPADNPGQGAPGHPADKTPGAHKATGNAPEKTTTPDPTEKNALEKSPEKGPDKAPERAPAKAPEAIKLTPHQQELADKLNIDYGLTVERVGDKFVYKYPNRDNQTVDTTDASDVTLEKMHDKVEIMRKEKIEYLEKTFNVQIAPQGQEYPLGDKTLHARTPRMDELFALERGLTASQPSTIGDKVNLVYLQEKGQKFAGGYFSDYNGKKTIMYQTPPVEYDHAMVESDAKVNNPPMFGHTAESITIHELGHHSQDKSGWNDPTKQDGMAREMGWEPLTTPGGKEFLLRGPNGEFYRHDTSDEKHPTWYRSDKDGSPLDASGKATELKNAQRFSDEQSKTIGAVHQFGIMGNPVEMQAEGFKYFRMGNERRTEMMKTDLKFYDMIKRQDQEEIDKAYGPGKFVRVPNGSIVENNEANRQAILQFENK